MSYKSQYSPGETKITQNRRNHMDPDFELKKIREIADEDIVKILGHRNPGEGYKSVHHPLEEIDFEEDMMKELVEHIPVQKKVTEQDMFSLQIQCTMHLHNLMIGPEPICGGLKK